MHELDRVRNADPQTPFTDANFDNSKAAFMKSMTMESDQAHLSRTTHAWRVPALVGSAVAVAAVATLVVVNINATSEDPSAGPTPSAMSTTKPPTPDSTPTANPTPQPTTTSPADAQTAFAMAAGAASAGGPEPGRGQWRKTTLTMITLDGYGEGFYGPDAPECGSTRSQATVAWSQGKTTVTFVNPDPASLWVMRISGTPELEQTWGDPTEAANRAAECLAPFAGQPDHELSGTGSFGNDDGGGVDGSSANYYASLPTDPAQLVDVLTAEVVQNNWDDRPVEAQLSDLIMHHLFVGAAPTNVRAAMYEALGLIGASTLVSTNGTLATVALTYNEPGHRTEMTFDTSTGELVGGKRWSEDLGTLVPSDVPDIEWRVESSIVDAID